MAENRVKDQLPQEAPADAPAEAVTIGAEQAAEPAPRVAPPLPEGAHFVWGIGRRKKATARVRIRPGTGTMLVNKRPGEEYFRGERDRSVVVFPLETAHMRKSYDVFVNVNGGGPTGQAGAIAMGLARALAKAMPEVEGALRDKGLMTRDARMKERKKYGQKGARKRFQFSKR